MAWNGLNGQQTITQIDTIPVVCAHHVLRDHVVGDTVLLEHALETGAIGLTDVFCAIGDELIRLADVVEMIVSKDGLDGETAGELRQVLLPGRL